MATPTPIREAEAMEPNRACASSNRPSTMVSTLGMIETDRVDKTEAVGPYGYDERYVYSSLGKAGAFGRYERVARDDWSTGVRATRTARYTWYPEAVRGVGSYD